MRSSLGQNSGIQSVLILTLTKMNHYKSGEMKQ
jgi:hypothetical protein